MRKTKTNNLTYGLFNYKFTWGGIKLTIKDFFIMLSRIKFVLKHGYYPAALYDTNVYFKEIFEEIAQWYMVYSKSIPADYETKEEWNEVLGKMRMLNESLGEDYLDYIEKNHLNFNQAEYQTFYKNRAKKQTEFFNLLDKNFLNLWD